MQYIKVYHMKQMVNRRAAGSVKDNKKQLLRLLNSPLAFLKVWIPMSIIIA